MTIDYGALPLLLVYVGGALGISFLCSILEASLLSVRTAELLDRKERGDAAAGLMLELKRERLDDAISAILTLNTIAHTIGAALAGAQAAIVFGDGMVGVFSGVLTLLVLVITEIIPKTVGTVHASRLAGFTARTTSFLTKLLSPVLVVMRLLTRRLAASHARTKISRREVAAMAATAAREGDMDEEISRAVQSVLRLREVPVGDVMTPRTVVQMMPAMTSITEFLENDRVRPFSRLPLHGEREDDVKGHLLVRDVLLAAARGEDGATPLSKFVRKSSVVREESSVEEVFQRLIEEHQHLALVIDEYAAFQGLVTLEDLVETAFGVEIVDELDEVEDLRAEAARLREQRLARNEWSK